MHKIDELNIRELNIIIKTEKDNLSNDQDTKL